MYTTYFLCMYMYIACCMGTFMQVLLHACRYLHACRLHVHAGMYIAARCRYYIAEGVKLYSQDTWKRVTEGRGVTLVEQHLGKVVEFYVSQSQAENHAVREAACACIAELGTKVRL